MHDFLCKETVFETEFSTCELNGKLRQKNCLYGQTDGWTAMEIPRYRATPFTSLPGYHNYNLSLLCLWTDRQMDGEPWRFQDTVLSPLLPCQGIITIILALCLYGQTDGWRAMEIPGYRAIPFTSLPGYHNHNLSPLSLWTDRWMESNGDSRIPCYPLYFLATVS